MIESLSRDDSIPFKPVPPENEDSTKDSERVDDELKAGIVLKT